MCIPHDSCSSSLSAIHLLHMLCCHSRRVWRLLAPRLHHQSHTLFCPLKSRPPLVWLHHPVVAMTMLGICMLALAPFPAKSHTERHHGGPKATQHKLADAEECIVSYQCCVLPSAECNVTVQRACASSSLQSIMCRGPVPHQTSNPSCEVHAGLSLAAADCHDCLCV